MLQLKNKTPFAANIAVFANEQGMDSLYVITKASFTIGKQWMLCEEQAPPQEADEYWGEPVVSSLKSASDFHIGKSATDIVMLGSASSKEGMPVRALDVTLRVANKEKTVRIFGDRVWDGGHMTRPEPFEKMPLVYERAYGGAHIREDQILSAELCNPVGRGYLGKRSKTELNGQPLPNLEDPAALIQSPGDQVSPACFGFVSPNWHPRVSYAGTYDERWQSTRAPFLPQDFSRRFLNAACTDLVADGFLQGGEPVQIRHMHPRGDLQFNLPRVNLRCIVDVDGEKIAVMTKMETVILEPNDLKVSLVWKSELACDKKVHKITNISLGITK